MTSRVLVIVAVLVAFAAPAAAEEIGLGRHDFKVEGTDLVADTDRLAQRDLDAGAAADVAVKDVDLAFEGPACRVADAASPSCSKGHVDYAAGIEIRRLEVEADVGLFEQGASAAPAEVDVASVPAPADEGLPATTVLVVAAGAAASGLAGWLAWRGLKFGLLGLGLYSFISDDELLDDENRARIFALIKAEPGVSTKDVANRLGLAWGTVTHHLLKLERRRFVTSRKYGKYRRYFANGAAPTDERKDVVAVLRLPRTADVAALIRNNPGMTQKEAGDRLGVSSSTVLWHVRRLESVALVRKLREGKLVRYFPTERYDTAASQAAASS
ncbi:MAG TPA: winged helix-turn-helix transcriptional regulator [Candidatus Thermoplasmatota archaeon]|nr:winged helix-turn-helix transcriptional regulator [Candidatus Thermoplasmatota archaeon]